MKIVVIGSIEAGVSAAMRLAAADTNASICVYEQGGFYTCGTCGLPHYLEEDLKTLQMAVDAKERELKENRIEAHLRHRVESIDVSSKSVTVRDQTNDRVFTEHYDKLVLATGNQERVPEVPGAGRIGVQVLKNVEDLLFLKEYIKTPYVRDIVILGAGYAGLEIAKSFCRLGRNVRIIEKENRILPEFDAEAARLIQKELEAAGITFQLGERVQEFPGQTFIEQVKTNRGIYPCDLCISAIGASPNTAMAESIGVALDAQKAIIINENLETNIPGIYAVGSCTAGQKEGLRTSSLRTAELEIARTGLTEEEAKRQHLRVDSVIASGNDRPGICPNPNRITLKLVYEADTHKILGAQAWGRKNAAARINAVAVAVAAGMTAEQLGQVGFVYASSASAIWDPIQIVCSQVRKGGR
ncbi:FAD-dependent oxidoreductase [uncultured Clostridium sp.]|uniref:FAD-dependent oxidoreductase n=1 Tax=uncultured Clostridium sp. TaxID=59620 RepID=UPI002582EB76|nr:FAD-dependent oxidoreductase [uncultured Clostridium sp.]